MTGCPLREILVAAVWLAAVFCSGGEPVEASREAIVEAIGEGNWAEALEFAKVRLKTPDAEPYDLTSAIECLLRLGRVAETDALLDRVVEQHGARGAMLVAVAEQYRRLPTYGIDVGGEFRRGAHRGGGIAINAAEADRVRRMRLLHRAIGADAASDSLRAEACQRLAEAIVSGRTGRSSWRLQMLTDLATVPDPVVGRPAADLSDPPVAGDGSPVLYDTPDAWDDATSDGELWRWAMAAAARFDEGRRVWADLVYADFLREQFGVQTLTRGGGVRPLGGEDDPDDLTSAAVLPTLDDEETIARLASGVRRFRLPPGHRYVDLYRRHGRWRTLAEIRLARNQRALAAAAFKRALESTDDKRARRGLESRIDQITEPWALFEPQSPRAAGGEVTFRLRHRNTDAIKFIARPIDVERLLDDARAYLDSPEAGSGRQELSFERLGYRMILDNGDRYLGDAVAEWATDVERGEDHGDGLDRIAAPFRDPGAYFVTASPGDGAAPTSVVVWVTDTVLVRKPTSAGALYAVLDARDGRPVAGASLELIGYRRGSRPAGERAWADSRRIVETVGDDGLVEVSLDTPAGERPYRWLAVARTEEGRFALLGFEALWRHDVSNTPPPNARTQVVTDRPAYRPGADVSFKAWVGRPDYATEPDDAASEYAHKSFQVELINARGDKVASESLTANHYGGVAGEFRIAADAPLGVYRINVAGFGGGRFRVEEYRKPEFEVAIAAPEGPTRLGDAFEATIRADYYFGAPVSGGRVRYRVERRREQAAWIPIGRWDWLYGRGYGWLGQEAPWRSDWRRWGCVCRPPWMPTPQGPAELVAEGEAELDDDGAYRIRVETEEALRRRPDDDHEYTITAEVTDRSRRTIDAVGRVLVARRPVAATVTLDRGHYEVGDTITASIAVRRPDGGPVAQPGVLRLLRIEPSPAADRPPPTDAPAPPPAPEETEVQVWDLASGCDGAAEMRLKASAPGRYRLVFQTEPIEFGGVATRVEAAAIFTIRGPGFDGVGFRFGAIEVVPDKSEYRPGGVVRLQVNTDRVGSTVALFVRPAEGVYARPQVLRIDGKTTVVDVAVQRGDQPNFFVEALTVAGGRVHTAVRQIVVPPVSRVLDVDLAPSSDVYEPGQRGSLKVRLTDAAGEPVVGDATVAVYDRAVDAVAPDVAPGDIRERFWSWRRRHYPVTVDSLDAVEPPVAARGTPTMQPLGVFGWLDTVGQQGRGVVRLGSEIAPPPLAAMAAPADAAVEAVTAGSPGAESEQPAPVRTNFADTAVWIGSVTTDGDGVAEIPMTLPESLTSWRIRAWAVGGGLRVGEGEATCVTRKDLMVRLQTPRFLVERDEAVLSALVRSDLPKPHRVSVRLEVADSDAAIELLDAAEQTVLLEPGTEARVDWRARADREAEVDLVARAIARPVGDESTDASTDAMRLTLPIAVHGAEIVDSFSATLGPDDRLATFEITIPNERRPEATRLEVRFTPTLVGAMVEALPYLIEYPHRCTEQTLNRFLPAVVTRKTLDDLGVDLEALAPGGDGETGSVVFDRDELDRVVRAGVRRLTEMQLSDGGWGWFSGRGERSSTHATAVVVRGLLLARRSGVDVPDGVVDRGVAWLRGRRDEQLARLANCDDEGRAIDRDRPHKASADNLDALVHLVLNEAGERNATLRDRLFADRLGLMPYGLAMLGVALGLEADATADEAVFGLRDRVLRNLRQFVVEDAEVQTAYLNLPGGGWWNWYGSEFEAHALFLKLLVAAEPRGELAPKVVKHLLDSRRSARRWNSTRDTALVVEALAEYAVASGEAVAEEAPMRVEVWIDGQRRQAVELTTAGALRGGGRFRLFGEELSTGRHTVEVRKPGDRRLYAGATVANFSLESDLSAAGLDLRVERKLYRLDPIVEADGAVDSRGAVVEIDTRRYRRVSLPNLGSVRSGELVEVELNLASKNDYEYLVIEDPKPAGCEPIDVRSGYNGNSLGAYVEFRDRLVRFYVGRLARGEHTVRYRMRAETPGSFAALPASVEAMYAPDLRGNSDELRLKVLDRPED